jgi:hydroxyacylglutathione hydrolase
MRLACTAALVLLVACSDDLEPSNGPGGSGAAPAAGGGGSGGSMATSSGGDGGSGGSGAGGGVGGAGGSSEVYGFPPAWPDGTSCATEAELFVWKYADDTYILRQSLCTSFEGPFLYLLFGDDRVLLEDTGDGGIGVQMVVQGIIDEWLAARGKASIELVVAHSHGHGDHVAGDAQFAGQPNTTVVGTGVAAVQNQFGITNWPTEIVPFDLGGRILDVIPIPGHQSAHVAFYDRRRELLLTGDTLYAGRLYISDFAAYKASTSRLVDFVAAPNPVTWVLGTHIEMTTTPGDDFAFGATQHPGEHPLELTASHLVELDTAVQAMGSTAQYQAHDDFIIYPL